MAVSGSVTAIARASPPEPPACFGPRTANRDCVAGSDPRLVRFSTMMTPSFSKLTWVAMASGDIGPMLGESVPTQLTFKDARYAAQSGSTPAHAGARPIIGSATKRRPAGSGL